MTYPKISNKQAKKEWIKALRSGSYVQGEGFLKVVYPDGTSNHCCLGVACELVKKGLDYNSRLGSFISDKDGEEYDGYPPPEFFEWLGFDSPIVNDCQSPPEHPWYEEGGWIWILIDMNDRGESFETIADWIEENM